jgi:hypothetical protein
MISCYGKTQNLPKKLRELEKSPVVIAESTLLRAKNRA